jgi:hypothetical protein
MLRVVSGRRRLRLVRLGIGIEHHALPPRLVQDDLHAFVTAKVCHPVEIGHHALVPGREGRLEMLRERGSDCGILSVEIDGHVLWLEMPCEEFLDEAQIDGLQELRIDEFL